MHAHGSFCTKSAHSPTSESAVGCCCLVASWGLDAAQGKFKYTKGKPKTYKSSATVTRDFCSNCGCQLTCNFVSKAGDEVEITTPTLDEPEVVGPSEHCYCSSQLTWLSLKDGLPRYQEEKPSLESTSNEP